MRRLKSFSLPDFKEALPVGQDNQITLLHVLPTMTFQDVSLDIYSIYSDNLPDIYSDILSDICSGIVCGSLSDIYSDILSGMLSDIYFDMVSDIYSDILSGIQFNSI